MINTSSKYSQALNTIFVLLLLLLITNLYACGGGTNTSPPGGTGGPTSGNSSPAWSEADFSSTNITWASLAVSLVRSGEDIYIVEGGVSNTNLLKTSDGINFTEYTTYKDMPFLTFIDEFGRFYFDDTYSNDLVNYTSQTEQGPYEYVSGNSTVLIGIESPTGIVKSVDRGDTWTNLDLDGNSQTNETVLEFSPAFEGTSTFIVIDATSGMWRSTDSGVSWSKILGSEGRFDVITANPLIPNTFFAAKNGGILVSTDGGANWSTVNAPQSNSQPISEYLDIELLDDGSVIAWGLANNDGETLGQVYLSSDSGQNWSSVGSRIGVSHSTAGLLGRQEIVANSTTYILRYDYSIFMLAR